MRMWGFWAATAMAVLATSGCGSKGSRLGNPVPVTGTVTLDGKPLVNATVTFRPEGGKGHVSTGVTDAEGKYELFTRDGDKTRKGAVPGKYRVWFSQMVGPDGKPIAVDSDTPPADLAARESLPPHYSDPLQTEETAEVGESGGTRDFKLGSKRAGGAAGRMPR